MNKFLSTLFLLPAVLVIFVPRGNSQTDSSSELYKEIAAMDEALFQAFNSCDIEKYKSFLTDDLEFYHDKGELTKGRELEEQSLKKLCDGEPQHGGPPHSELRGGASRHPPFLRNE